MSSSDCSGCGACILEKWVDRNDKEVRAFFCMKREKTRQLATKFNQELSEIPLSIWQEAVKQLVLQNVDELFEIMKSGPLDDYFQIRHGDNPLFINRFTYMGSELKTKDRAHCFLWEAKRNPHYRTPRTEDPQ